MSDIGSITWPLLILGVGFYFRNEIRAAFLRVTEVGPSGVKLAGAPATQEVTASPTTAAPNELIRGIREFISPELLDPAVQQIKSELARVGGTAGEQIETLAHALASVNIQIAYERNYRVIFGSQIEALIAMNGPAGALEQLLSALYANAAARYPGFYKTFSYEQWKHFFVATGLTVQTDAGLEISAFGRGFMKYMIDKSLPVQKPW